MSEKYIGVEAVYALPGEQELFRQQLHEGATVAEAVRLCGILDKYPGIDMEASRFGIYGRLVKADTVLRDKDRVEIYRPLIADPKEARRKRAAGAKTAKSAGGAASTGS